MEKLEEYIEEKKQKYVKLPAFSKIPVIFLAFISFIVGFVLILPLPEAGVPLSIIGLGVLSFEYKWAETLLIKLIAFIKDKKKRRTALIVGTILLVLIILYFLR